MRYPDSISLYVSAVEDRGRQPDEYSFVLVDAHIPAQIVTSTVTREVIQNPQAINIVEVFIPVREDLGLSQGYIFSVGRFLVTNLKVPAQQFLCQATAANSKYVQFKGARWGV